MQYEIIYEAPDGAVTTINYGILEKIIVCELDNDITWNQLRNKTLLLALITPFKTNGADAALHTTFYKPSESLTSIVTDVRNIVSCVGCVETRCKWGLIDQDLNLVWPSFAVGEVDESDGSDDEDQ